MPEGLPPPIGTETAPVDHPSYGSPGMIPLDLVISMRNQGLTPDQIVQTLQRQGFDPHQIYDALNQASIKTGVDTVPPHYFSPGEYPSNPNPIATDAFAQQPSFASQHQASAPPFSMSPPPMGFSQPGVDVSSAGMPFDRIESIAEAIVDEKWKELTRAIEKMVEWKDKVENRLAAMQQQVDDLRENYKTLHQGVLGKIGEYDKHITDLGVEIRAMEKVFKEVLPTLTDNVNELSEITKSLRKTL
ncbi:MAG: hypothetical protein QW594_04330 [Candidatus Woesearchaeota archaeon]